MHAILAAGFSLAIRGEESVDGVGREPRSNMKVPFTLRYGIQAMALVWL
jgi:hypothetical protein